MEISTRTLDRHIRRWLLTYKKIANKVMLSEQEVKEFVENVKSAPGLNYAEIVWNTHIMPSQAGFDEEMWIQIKETINSNFEQFMQLVKEKDAQLEEKNNFIFVLQHRLGELENKLKNTIALPDYTAEKNDLKIQVEKINVEKDAIHTELKKEKIKNMIYMIFLVIIVIVFIFVIVSLYR